VRFKWLSIVVVVKVLEEVLVEGREEAVEVVVVVVCNDRRGSQLLLT
jgi:hypothetical protein